MKNFSNMDMFREKEKSYFRFNNLRRLSTSVPPLCQAS